jgi:hypothetical protein
MNLFKRRRQSPHEPANVFGDFRNPDRLADHPIWGNDANERASAALGDMDRIEHVERMQAEQAQLAERLWDELVGQGLREGDRAMVELQFSAANERIAKGLAEECIEQGWKVDAVAEEGDEHRVRVVTLPFKLDPNKLPRLASDMVDLAHDFGCGFCGIHGVRTRD